MIVHAESSAVAAWLLGEPNQVIGRCDVTQEYAALRLLDVAERTWHVHALSDDVLARARGPFPVEPVRALALVEEE